MLSYLNKNLNNMHQYLLSVKNLQVKQKGKMINIQVNFYI